MNKPRPNGMIPNEQPMPMTGGMPRPGAPMEAPMPQPNGMMPPKPEAPKGAPNTGQPLKVDTDLLLAQLIRQLPTHSEWVSLISQEGNNMKLIQTQEI